MAENSSNGTLTLTQEQVDSLKGLWNLPDNVVIVTAVNPVPESTHSAPSQCLTPNVDIQPTPALQQLAIAHQQLAVGPPDAADANNNVHPTAANDRTCRFCMISFSSRSSRIRHEKTHDKSRPKTFRCKVDKCGINHNSQDLLRQHMMNHTGSLLCRHCGQGFATQYCLRTHSTIHERDVNRKFVCGTCPAGFTLKTHLERHELIHLGALQWACEFCTKRFNQKSNRNTHILKKHTHACKMTGCNEVFRTDTDLQAHKAHHQDNDLLCQEPCAAQINNQPAQVSTQPGPEAMMLPGVPQVNPQLNSQSTLWSCATQVNTQHYHAATNLFCVPQVNPQHNPPAMTLPCAPQVNPQSKSQAMSWSCAAQVNPQLNPLATTLPCAPQGNPQSNSQAMSWPSPAQVNPQLNPAAKKWPGTAQVKSQPNPQAMTWPCLTQMSHQPGPAAMTWPSVSQIIRHPSPETITCPSAAQDNSRPNPLAMIFPCGACFQTFNSRHELWHHINVTCTARTRYHCRRSGCHAVFFTQDYLQDHERNHCFPCVYCGQSFNTAQRQIYHQMQECTGQIMSRW